MWKVALAVGLGISVSGMAQVSPLYEQAPPPPPRPVVPVRPLQGVTAETLTVSQDVLRGMAEAEPPISAKDEAPQPGVVVVKLLVSKTGEVEEAVAVSGPGELPAAAVAGVKDWKYRPYMVDGQPQEVQSTVTIMFSNGVGKRMNFSTGGVAGMSGPMSGWSGPVVAAMAGMSSGSPAANGAVRVSSGVVQGLAEKQVAPVYPPIAKAAHVQGVVVLHAIISKTGDIENLRAVSGPPMLTGAAMDAVRQWKYRPYLLAGAPTAVDTTINVNFSFAEPPGMGWPAGPEAVGATAGDSPVFVPSGVMLRYLVASPQPGCGADASGMVVLRAIISTDGAVKDLQVVSAAKPLEQCSVDAVRQWRYRPYMVAGVPREVETMVVLDLSSGAAK